MAIFESPRVTLRQIPRKGMRSKGIKCFKLLMCIARLVLKRLHYPTMSSQQWSDEFFMFMLHLLKVWFRIIWAHLIVYLSLQIRSLISRRTFFLGSIFTHILLIPITFLMQLFQTLSILEAFSPTPTSSTVRGPALPWLQGLGTSWCELAPFSTLTRPPRGSQLLSSLLFLLPCAWMSLVCRGCSISLRLSP